MKYFRAFVILAVVVIIDLVMAVFQPLTNTLVSTANATITNPADVPEMVATLNSYPLWQWLLPGAVGVVMLAVVLLKP